MASSAPAAARAPRARTRTAFRSAAELPDEPNRVGILAAACHARARCPPTPEAIAQAEDRARVWDWDARIETSVFVLHSYLYRRARSEKWAGPHGSGRFACSLAQIVAGLAPQMGWTGTREELVRNHRRSVERWLDWLDAAELVDHCPQQDEDGWWWRTIITLLPLPQLQDDVVLAARTRLKAWPQQERHRRARGRGSRRGRRLRNLSLLVDRARLARAERRRRAIARRRQALADCRRREAQAKSKAPDALLPQPYGVPSASSAHGAPSTAVENTSAVNANAPALDYAKVSDHRTRVSDGDDHSRSGLTPIAPVTTSAAETESPKTGAEASGGPVSVSEGLAERLAGIEVRVAEQRWLWDLQELQAENRALEVASWGLGREWPVERLREAWVVARRGPGEAAMRGPARAGRLVREKADPDEFRVPQRPRDDYRNLRRYVALYERHYTGAGELVPGYPAGGLAALLHIGVLAREDPDSNGPATLAYAIGALGQLARRMRAHATHADPGHHRGQVARARARRTHTERHSRRAGQTVPGADGTTWPSWVALADDCLPAVRLNQRYDQELVTITDTRPFPPTPEEQREVLRDALLLRHGRLEADLDGRTQMTLRHRGRLEPAERRDPVDPRILELARLTGRKIVDLTRYGPITDIDHLLRRARAAHRRAQEQADAQARRDHLDNNDRPE